MTTLEATGDVTLAIEGHIALVEMHRPPHNYFDLDLIRDLATVFEHIDRETDCRAIVWTAEGRSFCAGAQFAGGGGGQPQEPPPPGDRHGRIMLYPEGIRLFAAETPVVAAIQGPAIGGGLGLALVADFRVASHDAWFAANFSRLGFHHGFGLTVTLPALVGQQAANRMLYTGRRIQAEEAHALGLCDELVPADELRAKAMELAGEIAAAAPLAVRSIRRTMRRGLVDRIREATDHEQVEQDWLRRMEDFREGVRATAERREPDFRGR